MDKNFFSFLGANPVTEFQVKHIPFVPIKIDDPQGTPPKSYIV